MSDIIFFDLDGTITDSAEGILKSVQHALQQFGIKEGDLNKLKCFLGPPIRESFMKFYHMSEKQADVAAAVYRERYSRVGMFENRPYPGIEDILSALQSEGKSLVVATSKPEVYAKQILDHFGLSQYFEEIVGASMDGSISSKKDVIEEALLRLGAGSIREDVLMVGDRRYDVQGALQCGIQCIGAGYGYGEPGELAAAGAVYIAEEVGDLIILSDKYRESMGKKAGKDYPDILDLPTAEFPLGELHRELLRQGRSGLLEGDREDASEPSPVKIEGSPKETFIKKLWRILYPVLIHYSVAMVVGTLAAFVISLWFGYSGKSGSVETITEYVVKQTVLLTGISSILALVPLCVFYHLDQKKRKKGLLGKSSDNGRWKIAGMYPVTMVFAITSSELLNGMISFSGLDRIFPSYTNLSNEVFAGQNILLLLLVVGVLAPIAEEVLFRGLVFKRVQDYGGNLVAIFVSSLLFGLYHGNVVQFVYASLLGATFGILMMRTNSLKLTSLAHITANIWSILSEIFKKLVLGNRDTLLLAMYGIFLILVLLAGIYLLGAGKRRSIEG